MMISALFSATFMLVARADIQDKLAVYCPNSDSISQWSSVTENYCNTTSENDANNGDCWYTGEDWQSIERGCTDDDQCVYPMGFRRYTLGWYNDPAICLYVPDSHDKKVEILVESDTKNANLCLHDASDASVDLNNVGSVSNCGAGRLYACFTAATPEGTDSNEDFGFYLYCNGVGCEQSDITVRARIRVSQQDWDTGKTGVADDLEHWCEYERGTTLDDVDPEDGGINYYTYPSELIPDEPSQYPFHITHLFYSSNASMSRPSVWLAVLAVIGVVGLFGY